MIRGGGAVLALCFLACLAAPTGCGGAGGDGDAAGKTAADTTSAGTTAADTTAADTTAASTNAGAVATVTVDAARTERRLDSRILGFNTLWMFDGMGIWSSETGSVDAGTETAIRELGAGLLRYPGGTVSHTFHWHEAVGPVAERKPQSIPFLQDERFRNLGGKTQTPTYGPDEFLRFCERIGAEPLLVCAFEEGTAEEAAAWVAYVNGRVDDDRAIGIDRHGTDWRTVGHWAARRTANGRAEPYGVTWFEIGNELDLERFQRTVDEYADEYLAYHAAMKAVDPSIRLGAVGRNERDTAGAKDARLGTGKPWNETLFRRCGERLDYLCLHFYSPRDPARLTPAEVLAEPLLHGAEIEAIRSLAAEILPGGAPPIAVTEHAMNERSPQPEGRTSGVGNASLLAAIVIADTIIELIQRDIDISCVHVLALRWPGAMNPFLYFASILDWQGRRTLAPQYHAIRLLADHLGSRVVSCTTDVDSYRTRIAGERPVPFINALAFDDGPGTPLRVVLVNRDIERTREVLVRTAAARQGDARARTLTGPGPDATNLPEPSVTPSDLPVRRVDGGVRLALPPLSLTVVELP